MAFNDEKKRPAALNLTPQRTMSAGSVSSNHSSSTSSSLAKPPRTPRFAEATSVHSPVDGRTLPFSSEQSEVAHAQPGDVGFGYIGNGGNRESVTMPMTPRSPLKSALKVPGTPGRSLANPLSPTFREEEALEQREELTEKEQARDLKIKTRVRLAKLALRGVNFSCSLIILSMLSASFMIFRATQHLPAMNGLPAWATGTNPWPQYVVLSCSCVSLVICIGIFIGYCRGGHHRAEKVGVYYTLFAVGWFIFSMIMWAVAAGIFQFTKNNSKNQDMWGWSCVENHRAELFKDKVNYALVCRLQNWGLICMIIEIIIEIISITLYSVIFYRYWSKRKLLKSMNMRDKARSDLYLAQLRVQSAPNTPGFGPKSPTFSQYALSPRFPPSQYQSFDDVEKGYGAGLPQQQQQQPFTPGGGQRLIIPQSSSFSSPKLDTGFKLQAPPSKANPATPVTPKGGFMTPSSSNPVSPVDPMPQINLPQPPPPVVQIAHAPMADGEQQYEAVPIPGAYAGQAIRNPPPPMQTRFA